MVITLLLCTLVTLFAIYSATAAVLRAVINTGIALEQVIDARTDELLDATDAAFEENKIQHLILRGYLVEVLEKKVLPTVGYQKPKRSEIEQSILQHVQDVFLK